MFWAISRVCGIFWAESGVCGASWVVSRVGGTFWSVSGVGGIKSAVRGSYNYGGFFLAVCGILVFGGNDFCGRRFLHNMAVNRGITGTAHQGGNFAARNLHTSTLIFSSLLFLLSIELEVYLILKPYQQLLMRTIRDSPACDKFVHHLAVGS